MFLLDYVGDFWKTFDSCPPGPTNAMIQPNNYNRENNLNFGDGFNLKKICAKPVKWQTSSLCVYRTKRPRNSGIHSRDHLWGIYVWVFLDFCGQTYHPGGSFGHLGQRHCLASFSLALWAEALFLLPMVEPKREKMFFVGETDKVTWAFFWGGCCFLVHDGKWSLENYVYIYLYIYIYILYIINENVNVYWWRRFVSYTWLPYGNMLGIVCPTIWSSVWKSKHDNGKSAIDKCLTIWTCGMFMNMCLFTVPSDITVVIENDWPWPALIVYDLGKL